MIILHPGGVRGGGLAASAVAPFLGLRNVRIISLFDTAAAETVSNHHNGDACGSVLTARGHVIARYYIAALEIHEKKYSDYFRWVFCHVKNLLQLYCLSVCSHHHRILLLSLRLMSHVTIMHRFIITV